MVKRMFNPRLNEPRPIVVGVGITNSREEAS